MRYILTVIFIATNVLILSPQVVLTIEGQVINDYETNISYGYNIPRSQPTLLKFRNNSLTYVNAFGYMLQAGDETPGLNNNNLDGEVISGNYFFWNGTDESSWTHALFTGYNLGVVIKYNYLNNTPNGIQRKSNGMTDVDGVIAYNIIKNPKVGIVAKGMNGVRIYNNTLYSDKTMSQTSRGLIDIHTNTDDGLNAASKGTKIFNNIFYTKNRVLMYKIYEVTCTEGFESDYNLFWCEAGEPLFEIAGAVYTFSEWQRLGYDQHSVLIDPQFNNLTDFVPAGRLDVGMELGIDLIEGLSTDARWSAESPGVAFQNGKWQVGARVFSDQDGDIRIWPNPASETINLLIPDPTLPFKEIRIYDARGRIVYTNQIDKMAISIAVPRSFINGLYNISLESPARERYVRKILIVR
jgi:Secretion system C-terminal sorting domain